MANIIANFKDGSFLEYDKGKFDDWCVYLTRPDQLKYAPRDYQYFKRLLGYGKKYGNENIYQDFVRVYDKTTKSIAPDVLLSIQTDCEKYGEDAIDIAIDLTIIYMGMIAEENKAFSRLGKRIKRLGVYQVLKEDVEPYTAANFSRHKKWRDLDAICKERGF